MWKWKMKNEKEQVEMSYSESGEAKYVICMYGEVSLLRTVNCLEGRERKRERKRKRWEGSIHADKDKRKVIITDS